ncbi:MAG TPA: DUF2946 family protein [Terriglobales bacterium]|jgi:hypothetical protein|nr:DUF2946 family protein [Terriglobales bacterium]
MNALVGGFRETQGCSLRNSPGVKEKTGVSLKIEMAGRHNTGRNSIRVLALTLAALFVLFAAQALTHTHADGQNEATCQLCQAAHLGPVPATGIASLISLLLATGYVQPFVVPIHQEFFFHDSPSRAPPSA